MGDENDGTVVLNFHEKSHLNSMRNNFEEMENIFTNNLLIKN